MISVTKRGKEVLYVLRKEQAALKQEMARAASPSSRTLTNNNSKNNITNSSDAPPTVKRVVRFTTPPQAPPPLGALELPHLECADTFRTYQRLARQPFYDQGAESRICPRDTSPEEVRRFVIDDGKKGASAAPARGSQSPSSSKYIAQRVQKIAIKFHEQALVSHLDASARARSASPPARVNTAATATQASQVRDTSPYTQDVRKTLLKTPVRKFKHARPVDITVHPVSDRCWSRLVYDKQRLGRVMQLHADAHKEWDAQKAKIDGKMSDHRRWLEDGPERIIYPPQQDDFQYEDDYDVYEYH